MLMRFLRALLWPSQTFEVIRLQTELDTVSKALVDVKAELSGREKDIRDLMDRILHMNGFPMLYTNEPAAKTPPKENKFGGVTQIRDFQRLANIDLAEDLERQAFSDTEFVRAGAR